MRRNTRRRPTGARRATSAAVALILGGVGLVTVNVYASATESGSGSEPDQNNQVLSSAGATIDCPDVGSQLTTVPDAARESVDKELALLDQQITEAYQQLQGQAQAVEQGADVSDSEILDPLTEQRAAVIDRIVVAIGAAGERPEGLEALAACTLLSTGDETGSGENGDAGGDDQGGEDQNQGGDAGADDQQGGDGGQIGNGPVAADFADINSVQPNAQSPQDQDNASTGEFITSCGVNANGLFNTDNVIVAPGVSNGAHHLHDYVGNQANNAFASDEDLANGDTTCEDPGDKSTYYWPVVRLQNGTQEQDAQSPGGGIEGNAGEIVTPKQVTLTFVGSPQSEVTAMPRLLRIITGDAKAFVNGNANANASWSCTGFEDRQLKDKYPICPQGSDVVRTFKFQSCWDGANIDSANHRTHVAFADAQGDCPSGFRAIPQLVQRIVYDVDAPSLDDGGRTTPLFALDSFPEQQHKPVTDHGDFINVFDEGLMQEMVDCINSGRQCGAGVDPGNGTEEPQEPPASEEPQEPPASEEPQQPPASEEPPQSQTPGADDPSDGQGNEEPGDNGGDQGSEPADEASSDAPVSAEPKVDETPAATSSPDSGSDNDQGGEVGSPVQTPPTAGTDPSVGSQTEPQAGGQGGLAATGTQLWPAALGGVFVLAGVVLLLRMRRRQY
ncbi:DUF1996 domain-containing protein [Streptomyces sp. NBC_00038]|uniref:DUF1996 domain-containing protein n=1 Tax=Streptomyces sp. NBC_00038 TaxID=2903615 RepID=UPI002250477F|nr:DUF1996 domain-containing protein [Streptomyces sp. NBC_00038]MCX5563071.1 DUF1996 domain-containing protein [Streptomyces sp. NBC_00038]